MKLVNERKSARGQNDQDDGSSTKNQNPGKAPNNYGDAMTEMMKRIKEGNVGLKKANRRFSEVTTSDEAFENHQQVQLKAAGKFATLDSRSSNPWGNSGSEDIFDSFRKGLKSPKINVKSAAIDDRSRRVSDSVVSSTFNFKSGLKPTPQKKETIAEDSGVDEMRKLSVRT